MSKKVGAHITCPHCNHKFDMELYCSIWGEYKENKELVLSDKINVAHCPRCNKETKLEFSLLYTNTPKKIAVWWEPKFDPQVEADAQGYKKLLPSSHLANAPRIRSWEEFKKKIIELEKNSEQQEAQYKSKTCSSKEDLIDIKLTATALFFLLLSLVDYRFPYGFYELLRFIVCGYCCYYAYLIYKKSKIQFRFIISLIFALIYNPFVKMSFEREEWFLINIMTAVAIVFFERTSLLSLISRKGYTPNNKLNASTVLSKEEFEKLFISYVNERKNNKNISKQILTNGITYSSKVWHNNDCFF